MRAFSELVQRFHEWSLSVNYDSNIINNSQYIWEIPESALEEWKHSLDNYADQFTEHTLAMYRDMFQIGKQMIGILIGCTSDDRYVRLHKLTIKNVKWHFTQVLCSSTINILDQNGISNVVTLSTGKSIQLPIVINAKTMETDAEFDLIDSRLDTIGTCLGEKYKLKIRDKNRLDSESWLATIDYVNGDFHLVRSNTSNERKFINYYNMLIQVINSIGTQSIQNASGGITTVRTISYVPSGVTPYKYVSPEGTIDVLTGPGEIMFKWDTLEEEKEPDSIDTIVTNIQDSIASGELESPDTLNADEMNYLYESMMQNNVPRMQTDTEN